MILLLLLALGFIVTVSEFSYIWCRLTHKGHHKPHSHLLDWFYCSRCYMVWKGKK